MATVQTVLWRPEINALTTPQSWRPRYVPRATNGSDSLAARIAQKHSALDEETVKMTITALVEEIKTDLINGNQSSLDDIITFRLSLNARLDTPDDPLPPVDEVVKVRAGFSRSFVNEVRRSVRLERLPMSEKLPVITSAEDTVFGLNDVLQSDGALRLTGNNLSFDPEAEEEGCILDGTRSGRQAQSRFVSISDTEITFLPDIPAQNDPWNNEYILSVFTHYTEHGTLRTGIYRRRLRTPLDVPNMSHPNPPETGILTGNSATPYAVVTGGTLSADEMLRVQAVLDVHEGTLAFNLLDMREDDGQEGDAVTVAANGEYALPAFSGSALSSLNLTVNNYDDLVKMIRNNYSGRLVDVLDVKMGA
jgi:hypothetical protein